MRRLGARLAWAVFVVWATLTLAFVVESTLPSDPARMITGPQARPQDVERLRKELGLDRPLYVQYTRFLGRLVHRGLASDAGTAKEHANCAAVPLGFHVDLGRSYEQRRPVIAIVSERVPRTLMLACAATLVQILLGVTAGTLAASKRKTFLDDVTVAGSLLGVSAPTFVTGLLLQWLLAFRLRLLPLDGYGETAGEHLASVVLPALTLGIFGAAYYTRIVRDEMVSQLGQDYVRTAKAKGLSNVGVVLRHALRNALMPIVTIFGMEFGALMSGAIVTEQIFRWPGLGSLSVNAMLDRDGPVIMGCVIVTALAVVTMTILVDFVYLLVDPRVRR